MPIGVISVKGVQNLTPGYSLNSKIQYQKGAYPMLILGDSGWKMYAEGVKVLKNLNLWEAPTFKGTFQLKPIFEPFDGKCWTLVFDNWRFEVVPIYLKGQEDEVSNWKGKFKQSFIDQNNNYYEVFPRLIEEVGKWNLRAAAVSNFVTSPFMYMPVQYLGGHGTQRLISGNLVQIVFKRQGFIVGPNFFPWSDLMDVSISGRGDFQTGGGWWGGGFGIKGALEGAAFASILNAATTKNHTETYLRFVFNNSELNFYTSAFTPQEADIKLSFLRGLISQKSGHSNPSNGIDIASQLQVFANLFKEGMLSKEEYESQKAKLLGS